MFQSSGWSWNPGGDVASREWRIFAKISSDIPHKLKNVCKIQTNIGYGDETSPDCAR